MIRASSADLRRSPTTTTTTTTGDAVGVTQTCVCCLLGMLRSGGYAWVVMIWWVDAAFKRDTA